MSAGHGPALAEIRRAVRLPAGVEGHLLVACSGGADSLALAAAAALELPGHAGLVTVDHGLQAGSAERADEVVRIGRSLGLDPCLAVRVTVQAGADGPEAAARAARLSALEGAAAEVAAGAVLLAHTLDDQAEQVLLGLARGSGLRSLAGMPERRGIFHRPLLQVRRSTTVAACAEVGLTPWDDPHNADPTFSRSRVRHRVLPVLEAELGPGVALALARTAGLAAADATALDDLAGQALADCTDADGALVTASIAALAPAVRSRLLLRAARAAGARALRHDQVLALDALICRWRGQGPVDLPGGIRAHRREDRLRFQPSAVDGTPAG